MGAKRLPCTWLWDMVIINERGDVLVCTAPPAEEFSLGNLAEQKLSVIVSGQRMKQFRLAHIMQDFTELPFCGICGDRLIYKNYDIEFFIKYLLDIGREDLIPRFEEIFK